MSPVCQNCFRDIPKPDKSHIWFVHYCECGKVHWLRLGGGGGVEITTFPPGGLEAHRAGCPVLRETVCDGVVTEVPLWYPNAPIEGAHSVVQLELMHTRAADELRVSYDFKRDGWVVQQPVWKINESEPPTCGKYQTYIDSWKEVGFFEAWAFEPEDVEVGDEK